ncbi:MAG TPA: hypothetical protein VMV83_10270 [Rectinemataceae bacterium]|nr:hypothetical protein [Rectinemataceae bacterium]
MKNEGKSRNAKKGKVKKSGSKKREQVKKRGGKKGRGRPDGDALGPFLGFSASGSIYSPAFQR